MPGYRTSPDPVAERDMIQLTKIFKFETAHAIHGYEGLCKNIHGHSYELHVTVRSQKVQEGFLSKPGFLVDFKDLKRIVKTEVVDYFDHRLFLSDDYVKVHPHLEGLDNLEIWPYEPSAENILLFILEKLNKVMPEDIYIHNMRIYETSSSYAEWVR